VDEASSRSTRRNNQHNRLFDTKRHELIVSSNDNFTIINSNVNNFQNISFRENTHPNYREETLSKLAFDEFNPLYDNQNYMKESLNFNNKFNEKFLSDDEVIYKSDLDLSNKIKKSISRTSNSEHKRRIKIKIVDEFRSNTSKYDNTEDSVNNLHVSNEVKSRDIKVNMFDNRSFIDNNKIIYGRFDDKASCDKEQVEKIKNKMKMLFFKDSAEGKACEPTSAHVKVTKRIEAKFEEKVMSSNNFDEEVYERKAAKKVTPLKEFDPDNLAKIKPSTSSKKGILIRN
jgi:hypothetical protein